MLKVVLNVDTERVQVFKNGELVGECESYEVDAICTFLEVQYEEVEE